MGSPDGCYVSRLLLRRDDDARWGPANAVNSSDFLISGRIELEYGLAFVIDLVQKLAIWTNS